MRDITLPVINTDSEIYRARVNNDEYRKLKKIIIK